VAVRGDGGDLCAGLYGWTWGGCGYIDLLWGRDDQRGHPLGARLLAAAAGEIRRRGRGPGALGNPFFQAPGFYGPVGSTDTGRRAGLAARARRHPPGEAAQFPARRALTLARTSGRT